MTTDPTPDLRTLAAEAIPYELISTPAVGIGSARRLKLADAVLATVLPAHRAIVLAEHVEKLRACAMNERREAERHPPDSPDRITHIAAMKAYRWAVQLAETRPEPVPASTHAAQAVPEATERRSAGCDDCDDVCTEKCTCPGCTAPTPLAGRFHPIADTT